MNGSSKPKGHFPSLRCLVQCTHKWGIVIYNDGTPVEWGEVKCCSTCQWSLLPGEVGYEEARALAEKTKQAEEQASLATSGEALRHFRKLRGMSQLKLSRLSRIPPNVISTLENNHKPIGLHRAERFAKILKVHPSMLVWPNWKESK